MPADHLTLDASQAATEHAIHRLPAGEPLPTAAAGRDSPRRPRHRRDLPSSRIPGLTRHPRHSELQQPRHQERRACSPTARGGEAAGQHPETEFWRGAGRGTLSGRFGPIDNQAFSGYTQSA